MSPAHEAAQRSTSRAPPAAAGHPPRPNRDLTQAIVERLRSRSAGLAASIAPLLEIRDETLANLTAQPVGWNALKPVLQRYDALLIQSLAGRYDALDQAVAESAIPFAEIDHNGLICYANPSFAEQVPGPLRQPFADLFGPRRETVAEALRCPENTSLRVELHRGALPRQFRAEIGPLLDDSGEHGAYALLLDLGAEEERLNAAVDGILRVDNGGKINFANNAAMAMLGQSCAELFGEPASALFQDPADPAADRVAEWIAHETGLKQDMVLAQSGTPVRVSVLPFYDRPGAQAGILLTFGSIVDELARQRLQQLLATLDDPVELIREIMRTIRSVVPFDLATFGTYTDDMSHFRTLVPEPKPEWPWSTRWFELGSGIEDWLIGGDTWADDQQAFVDAKMPAYRNNPIVRAMEEDDLHAFVTLPIRGTGGRFRSALTLVSKQKAAYGRADLERLRGLGLTEVLQAADAALVLKRETSIRTLKGELATATTAKQLARRLAKGVAQCFDWEYAAVFRVDRARNKFVLFAQHDEAGGALTIPDNYSQDLHEGMMHHALKEGRTLIEPDTSPEKSLWDFRRTADAQASAMTVPVMVNGRIELLIDFESSATNAFQGEDKQDVEDLIADCQPIFETRWQTAIQCSLMNAIEQAAVVVDSVGAIRRMNAAAEQMLGPAIDTVLSTCGMGEHEQFALQSARPCNQQHLTLKVREGQLVPTLGTQLPLNDDYGHRLWLFTNLREQRWERDWRYLDRTVSEVARQTRAPLLIADGLLRRAAGLLRSPGLVEGCAALLERAAGQLGKADLTFERLSDTLTAHQGPAEIAQPFDALALLRQSIQTLPADDVGCVDASDGTKDSFIVEGWPELLGFAFRSLLGHLLLGRATEDRVLIDTEIGASGELRLRFRSASPLLASQPPDPGDPIAVATERARELVTLAPDAIKAAIGQHGGTIETPGPNAPQAEFVLTLPPAPRREDPS